MTTLLTYGKKDNWKQNLTLYEVTQSEVTQKRFENLLFLGRL